IATVRDLNIARDEGRFHLKQGRLYGCTPVDDRRVAVLFVGEGTFVLKPPTVEEQQQLVRFYGLDSVRKEFSTLFLLFADTTWEELERRAVFTPGSAPRIDDTVKYCLQYLYDKSSRTFQEDFTWTFLHKRVNPLFHAHFSETMSKPFFFELNPFEEEEVRYAQRGAWLVDHYLEYVSQFHTREEFRNGTAGKEEDKSIVSVSHYVIAARIADYRDFSASATMVLRPLMDSVRWIPLQLYKELEVESVQWGENGPGEFARAEDSPLLWVCAPRPVGRNDVCSLTVRYSGDILEKYETGWIGLTSSSGWYPRAGYHSYANFDLTFRTPAGWRFASVGEPLSSEQDGDTLVTHWRTVRPAHNASFSIGPFKEIVLEDDMVASERKPGEELPNVTVLAFDHTPVGLGFRDLGDEVRSDMLNCMRFFQHVYGKSPVKDFYATETPYLHGEAFPGLIHLSWATFKYGSTEGDNEIFRAHEVAHQWWGVGVKYRTYHDQWLSEGISQYSGLWFMQIALRNNETFNEALDVMKKRILGARKFVLGDGQESGPIWLGYRTQSSNTSGDYGLIVYDKGAWVIHMLRTMLVDLQTMNEDRFIGIMREFYERFLGKEATTLDFQRVIERHLGASMDWFFKQWVMETKTPEYTFAYQTVKNPAGKYETTCRIKQENVAPDFMAPVVLLLKFDGDKYYRLRIPVTGKAQEYKLPLLPLEPEEIIFNDLNSVLCEVEYEDWE
ncbi:MAG: hypothetical protein IT282_11265, partial [Bacteroidetes bacterium]|nr:hypothetical protein [Bacteroidota bacterium]